MSLSTSRHSAVHGGLFPSLPAARPSRCYSNVSRRQLFELLAASKSRRIPAKQQGQHSSSAASPSQIQAVGSHEAEQVEDLMPSPMTDSRTRSAALHDFCMAIPYGLILLACGIISLVLGSGWSGARTLGAGVLVLALANGSLQNWRNGHSTRLVTLLTAGVASAVSVAKFQRVRLVQVPWVRWSNFGLSLLSAAMVLFLSYNMLAGGNPPKKDESDKLEEGDLETTLPEPAASS